MAERFVSRAPPPTPRQREVITIMIEECAEVQQRATKLLRFGPEEVQPGQLLNNAFRLGLEIGDLMEMIDLAINAGLVLPKAIETGRKNKRCQLTRFMQTDQVLGDG